MMSRCPHCEKLKIFNMGDPREYWLMTEVFVYLHGSDICNYKETEKRKTIDSIEKETTMDDWRNGLTDEEQAIIQYFRETHPAYRRAKSFDDIAYQDMTPTECLEVLRIFKNQSNTN